MRCRKSAHRSQHRQPRPRYRNVRPTRAAESQPRAGCSNNGRVGRRCRRRARACTSDQLLRYHRNGQYSITALTNGSGTILERYAYSAYGQPTFMDASGTVQSGSAESNRYTYTGREYDEALDLYHYRARMYDATMGRFCSRDPIGFEGSKWNLHEYVDSSPASHLDPSGNKTVADCLRELAICQAGAQDQLQACLIWAGDNPFKKAHCYSVDAFIRAGCMTKFDLCIAEIAARKCGRWVLEHPPVISTPAPGER